jgi:soluble lytic murein transglycosylase-like protein
MQIMPKTANYVTGKQISKSDLLHNIDLNVHISMRLLRNLHKRYGDWGVACGYYNTGYPKINDYARFCVSNKEYTKHWIKL